ncbi:MAG TPA: ATP-binding protein [Acidobacteriaceae bacterium]|nr:ATP-binding protein [Acidobacteriaceae bacterium]
MAGSDAELKLAALQERLTRTERALERAEQLALAGRFAGMIMHEINNPLEAVSNLVFLLREQPLNEQATRYLNLIEEQLNRVHEIAHKTLGFYRDVEKPRATDLVGLIHVALRVHSFPISHRSLRVQLELPPSAHYDGFPGELTQALSNLISNAVEASRHGGSLRIRLRTTCGHVHITIGDSGSGIPQNLRERLFEAFASGREAGHGLGLWVCRRAVEKHQGQIRWRTSTRPGSSGTTFRISLPQQERAPSQAA